MKLFVALCVVASASAASYKSGVQHNCLTREVWSAEKTAWCCTHKNLGCPHNCLTKEVWSAEKTAWCCTHKNLGCPNYSTANPELCSHVTCDIIKAHNCAYHEGTGRAGSYSAGSQNTLGMGSKHGGDGCRGKHGYGGKVAYDECHGKFQWRGALSRTCSYCETCTGSSVHHSMRIHHHNGETKCSQYKDVSCNGKGCAKKSQWERTVGAICGIGLVTGKAGCECRPQCGNMYEYIDGTCRPKSAQHSDKTACTCSNGTPKTSGCYSHADSCAKCNSGYFRHRVSTDTSTGWECVKMTTHGKRHRHNNVEHKCAGDNKYQTAGGACRTCAVGSYTHGGTNGARTKCSTCPAGSSCDGSSTVTRCSAGEYAAAGSRLCSKCSGRWYSAAGAAQCKSCMSNMFVPSGNTRCVACPAGHGCNGASKTPCSAGTAGKNGVCVACNQGNQYTSSDGARACQHCPAGSYLTGRTQCTRCPAGASCDGKTETPCSAGTYANVAGMAQCKTCPTGFHVTDGRKACTPCPSGHECDGTNKVVCPQGYRSENGACFICPAGTFGDRANCHKCAKGHSSQQGAASCGKCAASDYITNGKCVTCPAGHRCDGDFKYPCGRGTFAAAGATSCSNCAAGHVAGEAAASCVACAAGTTATRASTCDSCPAGHSCDGTNRVKCLPGYFAAGGASSCSPCGADNKYSGAGAAACKTCGEGHFTHGGQAGTRTHCDGCSFNVNRASGTLKSASDVGYICDGSSVKTKCDETKSYRHQVGTCVPTNGDDRHPYSKRFAHCLAKKSETACSPNDPEASPFTGDINTGCSWLQRDVHVTLYSNPRCVPKIRSTDIMSGTTGCPTCVVNGKAYIETTKAAGWTDPGAKCVDASGMVLSYESASIPTDANGQLKEGTHVLTYIAVDSSGKYSFACNNAHTWTRTVVVSAGSGNHMVTTLAMGEE